MPFALHLTERAPLPKATPLISQASTPFDQLWEICDYLRNYVMFSVSGFGEGTWDYDVIEDLPSIVVDALRQLRRASSDSQQIGTFLFTFGLQGLERQISVQRQGQSCLLEMLDARTGSRSQEEMPWAEYEGMLERFVSIFRLFAVQLSSDFRWELLSA